MKPTELKELIAARFKNKVKRPLFVESAPGIGKTQIASQVADELKVEFMAIHAPLLQPEDYGFPVISKDRDDVDFVVSKDKFPIEDSDCEEEGIFLIDELSQADASAQKILANLIQEREIHGKKLKKGWLIIATGNRTTDRAGANRILTHLKNRLTSVALDPSLDDWTNWALKHDVKPEVIAFIRFRPNLLCMFDPQQEVNATPRAWAEGVSPTLGLFDKNLEFETFKGDVGEGPAAELRAFLNVYRKLPSPDAILLNPKKADVPTDPATLYALCGAMVHRTEEENFGRVMDYIRRLPPEFGVLYVRDALARNEEIAMTKDFIRWASSPEGGKLLTKAQPRRD